MGNKKRQQRLNWTVTPWEVNGRGGWKFQPVILVEGQEPFLADHPKDYVAELERLHGDSTLVPGIFNTYIGQFKDAEELTWGSGEESSGKKSSSGKSNRPGT